MRSCRNNARLGPHQRTVRRVRRADERLSRDEQRQNPPADIDETGEPSLGSPGGEADAADDSPGDEVAPDSVTDAQLPEDLRPGDDNPLARPLPEGEGKDVDLGIGETSDQDEPDDSDDRSDDPRTTQDQLTRRGTDARPGPRPSVDGASRRPLRNRVLNSDWRAPKRGRATETPATIGDVVEEITTDFCGEIVAVDRDLDT